VGCWGLAQGRHKVTLTYADGEQGRGDDSLLELNRTNVDGVSYLRHRVRPLFEVTALARGQLAQLLWWHINRAKPKDTLPAQACPVGREIIDLAVSR